MSAGFIRLRRSPILDQLVLDRKAWSLLGIIASRARFHDGPNLHNLKIGEALVGDYKAAKLTRQEYRGALRRLERKWCQITTRPTNHGTIAKVTEFGVFDFSQPQHNQNTTKKQPPDFIGETGEKQPSSNHPTTIQQPLTNKERRKEGNNDDGKALGNSLAGEMEHAPGKSSSSSFFNSLEEAQKHPRWEEFARWAPSPTLKGFHTWLKNFPQTIREKPKRKGPRINLEAAARASIARADKEDGLHGR